MTTMLVGGGFTRLTKEQRGLCVERKCSSPPAAGDKLCAPCRVKKDGRHLPCPNCGHEVQRDRNSLRKVLCGRRECAVEWRAKLSSVQRAMRRASIREDVAEPGCKCARCAAARGQEFAARAALVARVAAEMGVPVSPLAGTVHGPLNNEDFAARWAKVRARRALSVQVWR